MQMWSLFTAKTRTATSLAVRTVFNAKLEFAKSTRTTLLNTAANSDRERTYLRLVGRVDGIPSSVNTMISSPVAVLMS